MKASLVIRFVRRLGGLISIPVLEADHDGLEAGPRRWATLAIATGTFMAVLDGTVANVALPTLARELHVAPALSIWIVNAFGLALIGLLLPLAALGDIVGYARVYTAGLVVFTLGSSACAVAPNFGMLIAARVLQGCGAAGILSIGPALYRSIFPRALLGRGIGVSAMVVAVSSAAGPTVGGAILSIAPWPWLFAVNVPIGMLNILLARRALPQTAQRPHRLDIPSVLTSGLGFILLVFGLQEFAHHVPLHENIAAIICACALIGYFIVRQTRIAAPLVPPSLFAVRRFSLAAATSLISFAGQGITFVLLPFYIRETLHASALHTGILLSTWPLTIAVTAPIAGRLSDRYPPSALATGGLAVLSAGLLSLSRLPVDAGTAQIVASNIICGIGFGFFQSPNNRELLGTVPRTLSGSASGVLAIVRVLGQTFGAATAAITLGDVGAHLTEASIAAPFHLALGIAAVLACMGALVSATRITAAR